MRKLKYLLPIVLMVAFTFSSCEEEEETEPEEEIVEVNETSIIPATTFDRPNNYLGCVEISSRITSIEVWDHGIIDGDIVSIIANNNRIIDEVELDGPDNPIRRDYNFGFNGFNSVILYAHNEGDISPNTCTVAINGVEFILEANLSTNGAIDIVVEGFGVDCSNAGGGGTGGGGTGGGGNGDGSGGGNGDPDGDVKFFITQDFGCGNISVNVAGVGTSSITGYFDFGSPECSNTSAGGNFNDLPAGTYNFDASCSDRTWSGDFTITAGSCLQFELL